MLYLQPIIIINTLSSSIPKVTLNGRVKNKVKKVIAQVCVAWKHRQYMMHFTL